jgi:hypothetical protein
MKIWKPLGTAKDEEAAADSAAWMSGMLLLGSAASGAAAGGPPGRRDCSTPDGTIAITPGASCSAVRSEVGTVL